MSIIGLIGYGYWGTKVSKILTRYGFELDTIFTSKLSSQVQAQCRIIQPISEINIQNISHLTHLFILTGPPYHHEILKKLQLIPSHNNFPFLWLEKPFYLSESNSRLVSNIERRLFVDYPYANENASASFIRSVNKYSSDSKIEINIFSRYNIRRNFDVIYDFMPHIVSLMRFFVNDLNSFEFCDWRIEEFVTTCARTGGRALTKVYAFAAVSDSNNISLSFNFGINNPNPSFIAFAKSCQPCLNLDKLEHDHALSCTMLLDEAFPAPVDQNIKRFLSFKSSDNDFISDFFFHQSIAQITHKVKLGFDSVAL